MTSGVGISPQDDFHRRTSWGRLQPPEKNNFWGAIAKFLGQQPAPKK